MASVERDERNNFSIFDWIEDRTRLSVLANFLRHKEVPRHKHSIWYVLGGLAVFLFGVQALTGILLLLYYSPSQGGAYESVQFIIGKVPFGWFIRSTHIWSSHLLVGVILAHMASVFFLKSYRKPRELMWISGVILLFLVLGFGFTGYLLPWDTTAFFATKIGTEIPKSMPVLGDLTVKILRGGEFISEETLKRLFALHVVILPAITFILVLVHLILNQVHGSSVPIGIERQGKGIPFYPNYLFRDVMSWLTALILLMALVLIWPQGLGPKADAFASAPMGIRPSWYFLPLFETFRLLPANIAGINSETVVNLGVTLFVAGIFCVPFVDRRAAAEKPGRLVSAAGLVVLGYLIVATCLAYIP